MKIGLLVDSASTYDASIFKETNIELIPLHIVMPDNTEFLDTNSNVIDNKILERVGNGENVKTSQASIGELEQKYQELLKKYDHVVHIPITKNLSSMLQTASLVSQDEKFIDKVTVYQNTDLAAQAISEIALRLDQALKDGSVSTVQQAIEFIDQNKEKVYVSIIPGDLKKLSSGGRATGIITTVLNIFKTKLLIVWAKDPIKEAFGRTYSALTEKVIKNLKDKYKDKKFKLFVLRTPLTSDKTFDNVIDVLKEEKINFIREMVPNIYTVHAGIETIGFVAIEE
ncbi:DegV family protein [Mycoplasma putrefaciens]|uniref:DegV family protein n=1 Tax=Mycoplasma putrefaciens TaxID=2123 RepID=UPI003DA3AC77